MPPLLDPLFEEATAKLTRLDARIHDAQSFQIPRLSACKGPLSLQQRYALEIKEDIDAFGRELQVLESFVDDLVRRVDREAVQKRIDEATSTVTQLKKESRAALLASKRIIDSQSRSEKEELLRSAIVASQPQEKAGFSQDALMNANDAVTEALRRTTQLMQQELERSVLSTQMLDESTQTMTRTSDIYTSFGTLLTTSKTLVTALEKSDWLDRLLILSSLAFFLLVVAYVLKKRIIDKGLWLAFWWVKYLPLPSPSTATSVVRSKSAEAIQSVTKTAAAVITTVALSSTSTPPLASPIPSGVDHEKIQSLVDKLAQEIQPSSSGSDLPDPDQDLGDEHEMETGEGKVIAFIPLDRVLAEGSSVLERTRDEL